ncbi:hypothetical protein T11_16491 [Trichinella zimbabwensis]|uniref:Uncharacterized protein n=1 Tax=Trichinella zimbabwensis TaxID=268475 RepID=A0A0V1HNH4_9BILA|nr:hypothetical protein T11_16491 [Trichinella zimbabwensis]
MQQRYRTLSVAVETDDVSKGRRFLLFMKIPYEGSKLSQSRKQNTPINMSALPTRISVVLTVLLSVVVGQVATNVNLWLGSTICLYENACEWKKSNNLARCQLLTDYHERSDF